MDGCCIARRFPETSSGIEEILDEFGMKNIHYAKKNFSSSA
jgi:hypothetical protein